MHIERVKSYLSENPTAYAGLRALNISSKKREKSTAESDEVPFIFSMAFVPLLTAYSLLKRLAYCLKRVFNTENSDSITPPDHVFVMTSAHEYRTYTFEQVGKRLLEKDREVMFLCSPSAAGRMSDWRKTGFQTESFKNLLQFVSVFNLLLHIGRAIITTYELRRVTSGEFKQSSLIYGFNSIFLEYIKFSSLSQWVKDDPAVHTYSLMPYQVRATVPDRLYVYQHGVQFTPDGEYSGAKSFFPSTLLLWGKAWIKNFAPLAHPESKIYVTGSPWHSYLSEMIEEGTNEWDILFLGGSQVTEHSEKREQLYEELVANLVDACENNGWSLAIKLHPTETDAWYRQHNHEHHVKQFESLEDAINGADIAVTHYSSAFIECIAMGTPVILSEEFSSGLDKVRPVKGAYFIENDKIKEKIKNIRKSRVKSDEIIDDNCLVEIGTSIDMIMEIIYTGN
jgi:hypothetical protein